MASTVSKNRQGYGYKYTDLSQINEFLDSIGYRYYQYIENIGDNDYIYTVPIRLNDDGSETELSPRRGCRVIQATLSGKSNPAQENGSAITYARRYSLLMAFGLATDDDDAESLSKYEKSPQKNTNKTTARKDTPEEAVLNQQMIDSVDKDFLPHGEGVTPIRLAKLRKAQEFCGKNDATILATAKCKSFEEMTEGQYLGVMSLFLKLLNEDQKKEISAIKV